MHTFFSNATNYSYTNPQNELNQSIDFLLALAQEISQANALAVEVFNKNGQIEISSAKGIKGDYSYCQIEPFTQWCLAKGIKTQFHYLELSVVLSKYPHLQDFYAQGFRAAHCFYQREGARQCILILFTKHKEHLAGKAQNFLQGILHQALSHLRQADLRLLARERAEQLYESEQNLESVLEWQTEMLCRFDAKLRLTFVNKAYAKYFGREKNDLLGLNFLELVPEEFHTEIRESLKRLTPFRPRYTYVHSSFNAKGKLVWQEWTDQAIFDSNGKIEAYQSLGRDITALRKSEMEYQHLLQNLRVGVVYHDADGSIVQCNPAAEEILGLSRAQMQGKSSMDKDWRAIRADGSPFPGEEHPSMITLRSGEPVYNEVMGVFNPRKKAVNWILVSAVSENDPQTGRPLRVLATFSEISKELGYLHILKEQSRVIEKSAKLHSHLLKSPLQQILSSVRSLENTKIDGQSLREATRQVNHSAQEMERVLSEIFRKFSELSDYKID